MKPILTIILLILGPSIFVRTDAASANEACNEHLSNHFPNLPFQISQPSEFNRSSGGIRRWLGRKTSKIRHTRLVDLADDMESHPENYSLVFRGERGLFTDLGVFDHLETNPSIESIAVDSKRTFFILPLQTGNYVVYLRKLTDFGEELAMVASSIKTGALVDWFAKNVDVEFPPSVREAPVLDLRLSTLAKFTRPGILSGIDRLSKIYEFLGNNDLSLAVKLASYHNQLQYLASREGITEEDVVSVYRETKRLLGFWADETEVSVLTFFGLLSGISPEITHEVFEGSGGFWSSSSDRLAVFMGVAAEIRLKQLAVGGESLSSELIKETLEKHVAAFKAAGEKTSFWRENGVFNYLAGAISGKLELSDFESYERRFRYFYDHAKGDHDGQLLIVHANTGSDPDVLTSNFNELVDLTDDGDIALSLLMAVQLDKFSMDDVKKLWARASFTGRKVSSEENAKLLLSGMKSGLRPSEMISVLQEVSAYTGNQLTDDELVDFVDSIVRGMMFSESDVGERMGDIVGKVIADEIAATMNSVIISTVVIQTMVMNNSTTH